MSVFWELESFGNAVALRLPDGGTLSHVDLAAASDRYGLELREREIFGLECAPTVHTVAAYIGALRRGAVPLLLDAQAESSLKQALYRRYGITRVMSGLDGAWHTIGTGTVLGGPELAALLSTSGSTGSPKLVRLSHENLTSNAHAIANYMGLIASDVGVTNLPLNYSYGLSVLNSHFARGASVFLTDATVTTAGFWRGMREGGVTNLAGVPTVWRILRKMRFENMDLPDLRLVTQAGGKSQPDEVLWLVDANERKGRQVFVMYGQTEATARISYVPAARARDKAGSIGIAIPGGQLRIVDEKGREVGEDIDGQLMYRGPNVMLGYANEVSDLAEGRTVTELATGDMARRDRDGFYWITGRINRFIKIQGSRFNLEDVERLLHERGLEAAAIGNDDQLQVVVAGALGDDDLRAMLARLFRIHHSSVAVAHASELPRSSSGKIDYGALRQLVEGVTTPGDEQA